MDIIYQNFDTLEISFQCALPRGILLQLEQAKKEAQSNKNPVYAEIGVNRLPVMVHEMGARGGYTYQFSTGHDKHIWLVGDREDTTHWNVRVKVRSLCLALYGYEQTKEDVLNILDDDLRAKGPDENYGIPVERVSRFDYCVDIILKEPFNPNYHNFVCHGRTKKAEMGGIFYNQVATGENVETVTLGKMPNRQVTIYNKTKEIIASHKSYWWELWGINKNDFKNDIWRIEIRAGKKELNKWNLRTFDNFEEIVGNVINKILNDYKYTIPNKNDDNRTRWPISPIWQKTINAIKKDLFNFTSETDSELVLNQIKEVMIERYEKQIKGLFIGYTALTGKDIAEIPGVLDHVCGQMMDDISNNPNKFRQKHNIKLNKFSFLETEQKKSGD